MNEETATRHLHWQQQGIRSTRVPVVERNTVEMMEPELPGQGKLHHNRQKMSRSAFSCKQRINHQTE